MLALSPMFSTTYAWPLMEDLSNHNLHQDCNQANSYHSYLESPKDDQICFSKTDKNDQIQHGFASENSMSSGGGVNGNIGVHDPMNMSKNINHNAIERDRRKRVNKLYALLRSLLPVTSGQKKKVSIPRTILNTLKYIPELQKEVETLTRQKERLLSYSSTSIANTSQLEHLGIKNQTYGDAKMGKKLSIVSSSVSVLSEKDAMIQLVSSNENMAKNKDSGLLSEVLEYLEQEEDGFILLNSTICRYPGQGMLLITLHFQMQGDNKIEAESLKEKLCSFHQQLDV